MKTFLLRLLLYRTMKEYEQYSIQNNLEYLSDPTYDKEIQLIRTNTVYLFLKHLLGG